MNELIMSGRRNKRSEASKEIAKTILEHYQPTSAKEMQEALKDIFGPMFEAMLQGEMDIIIWGINQMIITTKRQKIVEMGIFQRN